MDYGLMGIKHRLRYKMRLTDCGLGIKYGLGYKMHTINIEKCKRFHTLDRKVGVINKTDFSIKWSIVTRAISYRGNPSCCNLCLMEKLCILSADRSSLLNKTEDLNLLPSADMKTSSTRPIRNRIAPTVLHELSLNCIPPTSNSTV